MKTNRFRHIRGLLLALTVLLVLAGTMLFVRRSRGANPEGRTLVVSRTSLVSTVQEVGIVEPLRKVDLKSKVAGQVLHVMVDVGDHVKAGDVLVKLDPLDAERELAGCEARVGAAVAQLSQARAQCDYKRVAHARQVLSDLELAQAEGDVRRFEAQVRVERSEVDVRRDRLAYTNLRAPIDGVVLARNVQPGEMVTPGITAMVDGKPLLVIAQIEKLLVRTELNQIDVVHLKPGDPVQVHVDAIPEAAFHGEVFRIAAMAQKSERRRDSNLQVFPIDVIVDRSAPGAEALRPGMMADITINTGEHTGVLVVPIEALVRDGGKTQLRVIGADGRSEKLTDVVAGLQNDQGVEILSGVNEGDRIRINPVLAATN